MTGEAGVALAAATVRLRGASVVVLRPDAVLLVERGRPPFRNVWSFPGGGVEPGEDATQAARRELREETGLVIDHLAHIGEFAPAPDRSPMMLDVFAARAGEGEPRPADDVLSAEFVPLGRVLDRPRTPGSIRWIVRAARALGGL